jgi:hypothetical protein
MAHLAGHDKFVTAIPVVECNSRRILQYSHLNAVVASSFVVWLVEGPRQVVRKRWLCQSRAPSPLSLATSLSCASPVVEVVWPGTWFFETLIWLCVLTRGVEFTISCEVAETSKLIRHLEHYRRQTHAAAFLKILLPCTLSLKLK